MLRTITGTGTGAAPVVNITWPLIDNDHLKVEVDGAEVPFTWTGASQITFDDAVAVGAEWRVYGDTSPTVRLVDFTDSSVLTEAVLDRDSLQSFYRDQELSDRIEQNANDIATIDDAVEERARDAVGAALRLTGSGTVALDDSGETITIHVPAPFTIDGAPPVGEYPLPVFTPEQFGAEADDPDFDNGPALNAMATAVNSAGGGIIWMKPGAVYWVGEQVAGGTTPWGATYRFAPLTPYIVHISGTTKPVHLMGNGSVIRARAGFRYGSFDAAGEVYDPPSLPFTDSTYAAAPYTNMIRIEAASGPVMVESIELDGNIGAQIIGGEHGDTGRQIGNTGIDIVDNTGSIQVRNIYSHHHGQDGGHGQGPGLLNQVESVRIHGIFANNGRQGFSLVGGNGWIFEDGSQFIDTGQDIGDMEFSLPGAGIDLEAEGSRYVVNTQIGKVLVSNNKGKGILMPQSAFAHHLTIRGAIIIGTEDHAHWLAGAYVRLYDTTVVGRTVNMMPSANPEEAFQMHGGMITDDEALSPTGVTYGDALIDAGGGTQNILFNGVHWKHVKAGNSEANGPLGVYATQVGWRLHNCVVENASPNHFWLPGIYSGDRTEIINTITFPGPAAGSMSLIEAGPALDSFNYTMTPFAIPRARYKANLDQRNVGTAS